MFFKWSILRNMYGYLFKPMEFALDHVWSREIVFSIIHVLCRLRTPGNTWVIILIKLKQQVYPHFNTETFICQNGNKLNTVWLSSKEISLNTLNIFISYTIFKIQYLLFLTVNVMHEHVHPSCTINMILRMFNKLAIRSSLYFKIWSL